MAQAGKAFEYSRRRPERTALYGVVREHLATFYAAIESGLEGRGVLPEFVRKELDGFLDSGLLCRGFAYVKSGWWASGPERRGLRCVFVKEAAQSRSRRPAMEKVRFVGLDVHKDSIAIAVADDGDSKPQVVCEISNDFNRLLKELRRLQKSGELRCCYEAGPTGFTLARQLKEKGIECMVVAPSLIPKQVGSRVKTDTRDAVRLARFLRSGDLTAVHVPEASTEAMRDLERGRQDARKAERVARHQLAKFLLRHDRRYAGKTWTEAHMTWIRAQVFEHEAHNRVLVDYVHAVDEAAARVERLGKDIVELVEMWAQRPLVKALQAMRGIRLLSAVTFVAEIGDFARFSRPAQLMAYLGLVPSEHSSGESVRRGGITRTGNKHVRTALVESAWAYRFRPARGPELRKRSEGVAPEIHAIAWKAQVRLHGRYTRLMARGKNKQRTVTAVARELAAFIWDIARQPRLLAA